MSLKKSSMILIVLALTSATVVRATGEAKPEAGAQQEETSNRPYWLKGSAAAAIVCGALWAVFQNKCSSVPRKRYPLMNERNIISAALVKTLPPEQMDAARQKLEHIQRMINALDSRRSTYKNFRAIFGVLALAAAGIFGYQAWWNKPKTGKAS